MRLADSVAVELAQRDWDGLDEPGYVHEAGIRAALERCFDGEVCLEDVYEWARPLLFAVRDAGDALTLEARLLGAVSAALIVGARLRETSCT